MPSLSMVFDVLAIDRASAVFDRVGDSAGAAGAKVDAATTSTTNAGAKIAAGLGVAAAAAAAYSVKLAADFQQSMTRLVTTAGETAGPNGIGLVSKGILDMAGQVGISAEKLAQGMYTVESAGIHGADALNVLKAAAQGAVQEQADLGKTTDALTTILHDYNIPASDAADVMSKLVTAVSTGKTNLEDFSGSLHSVTPLAAALHVPLADILGDLAAMTASGESADQATQNMADALRHLQAPTAQMTAELAQVGITSQDLSADLGTKGLAGTMQEIEQAILQHLDPATQKVLLPAFNESKTAAADLVTMIGHMPPALAQLSQGLLDGSVAVGDYRKQVQGMGGEAGATGLQFLSLYKSSDGFNQILKQGGPAAQEFTAALQKAVGDSAGLTVALQLTGEHAATVNDNIAKISGSSREAGGNIKGWAEVQGNFNQQLHEAGAALESMAIEFGTKLLPYLTDGLHFITTTAIPGIEHMGAAVGDAAHWFSQLPQPVKDMALALAALRLADMIGVFDKLGATVGGVRGIFSGFRQEMQLQQQLYAMQQAAAGAEGSLSNLGAAGATALTRLRTAGQGLVSMFGGPWGLAIAGAAAGVGVLTTALHAQQQTINDWSRAILDGSQDAQKFQQQQDNLTHASISGRDAVSKYGSAWNDAAAWLHGYSSAASEANAKAAEQYKAMTPLAQKQQDVTKATNELNTAVGKYGPTSLQAAEAASNLRGAQDRLTTAQNQLNDAQKTGLQRLQDLATASLGAADSALAAQQADTSFRIQQQALNDQLAAGTVKGDQLTAAQLDLAQSAENAAKAAAQHAADLAKQSGATDTTSTYQQVLHDKLVEFAQQLQGPGRAAIQTMIDGLGGATAAAGVGAGAIKDLQAQIDNLHGRNVTISLIADASGPGGAAGPAAYAVPGSGLGGLATGGVIPGYAPGVDSVYAMLSPGEGVLVPEAVRGLGGAAGIQAINSNFSSRVPSFADGGVVGSPVTLEEIFKLKAFNDAMQSMANTMRDAARTAAAAASTAGIVASGANVDIVRAHAAAYGWDGGLEWTDLVNLINQESGFNNVAQNPTSTAYGMFQFLDSTWAGYGPKTSDPNLQAAYGLAYVHDRYGDPIGAWGHEMAYNWYDTGGWLPPGLSLAYNGTGKPERVSTADQAAALLSGPARITGTLRIDGDGLAQIVDGRIEYRNARTAVDARSAL